MTKPTLIVLHGALGSKDQFKALNSNLEEHFDVHSFNFAGHGGLKLPSSFTIELFTKNLTDYLSENQLNEVLIFGYSMGGYVALNLARTDGRIKKIVTLGTKFHWTPESASKEIKMLNPEKVEEKIPAFAKSLAERHAPQNWKEVMLMTADMMVQLGTKPVLTNTALIEVNIPVTIGWGDQDNMVTKEESETATRSLRDGNFKIFEGFKHPIEQVNIEVLAAELQNTLLK